MQNGRIWVGLLVLLISLQLSQCQGNLFTINNFYCYANCKANSCLANSPQSCTDCDKGLVNINGVCYGGYLQPDPIVLYKPNANNQIVGINNAPVEQVICTVQNGIASATMVFSKTIGSTLTQNFTITTSHSYIQLKFNAIVLGPILKNNPSISLTIYSNTNIRRILLSRTETLPVLNNNIIQCNKNQSVKDIFLIDERLSSSEQNILVELKGTDIVNDVLGVSDVEVYYGGCSQQCATCVGPSINDCLTCRGLLLILVLNNGTTTQSGTCTQCPDGFYNDGAICRACSPTCKTCALINNIQQCLSCDSSATTATTATTTTTITTTNTSASVSCSFPGTILSSASTLTFTNTTPAFISSEVPSTPITSCGYYSLLGGIAIGRGGSTLTTTYTNLIVHTSLTWQLTIFLIDQQPNDLYTVTIKVDNTIQNMQLLIAATNTSQQLTNQCGQAAFPQYITRQQFKFTHSSPSAVISISGLKNYFGIRDINLFLNNRTNVNNCYSEQTTSTNSTSTCESCINGYSLINNTCNACSISMYAKIDNNATYCMICPIYCASCANQDNLQSIICLTCQLPYVLDGNTCVDLNNWLYTAEIVDQSAVSSWVFYPKLQQQGQDTCGNDFILGASQIKYKFMTVQKVWRNLPSHSGVKIFLNYFQIDDYANDQSVFFMLNGKKIIYTPIKQRRQLCGNSTPDAIQRIYLEDTTHTSSELTFELHILRMVKFGINNLLLFLEGCTNCNQQNYMVETIPIYSIDTPPILGMQVKLSFDNAYTISNPNSFSSTFKNYIVDPNTNSSLTITNVTQSDTLSNRRRLDNNGTGLLLIDNTTKILTIENKNSNQIVELLSVGTDLINDQLYVRPILPNNVRFTDANGAVEFISTRLVTNALPRYVNVDENSLSNRSSMRNLKNLFAGCAIIALWLGLASFLVGISAAFDDFFILCQVIFVHIFLQLRDNPPSFRIPLEGFKNIQFLAWLPWQARKGIQKAILPTNLYQYSPIQYEQYYQDITFARSIYHTVLFLALMVVVYILLKIFKTIYESKNANKQKYVSYFQYYYYTYQDRGFTFFDKVVRFVYFTIAWACVLQFTHFANSPQGFHVWNSIICILLFILILAYPVIGFFFLKDRSESVSESTYHRNYEEVRVDLSKLYYFLFKYYKLVYIACIIGFLYNSNPVIPLILLIVIHVVDAVLIITTKPFGMIQDDKLEVVFYPYYPRVYYYTTIIQQFLFVALEVFILILYGQKDTASGATYMGIGYVCCAIIILLLINGLLRLIWGFFKIAQMCHSEKTEMMLSIEKKVEENKQEEENPINEKIQRNPTFLMSERAKLMSTRKMSYVSQLRG